MTNKTCITALFTLFAIFSIHAQSLLDGYVFEANNRGFLNQAKVSIVTLPDHILAAELASDEFGHFTATLPAGSYRITTRKDLFFDRADTVTIGSATAYLKVELRRRPGYLFDATLAEARTSPDQIVDAVTGARIEIYNRTAKRPELALLEHPEAFFNFTFEQGNHYTIMVRKPGYITKRIEAYINIEGCILCIDGVRDLTPGVTENLTANNTMGTLLSNIELEKAQVDKRITLRNIYYDYDKWNIRPDAAKQLDKVVTLMKDNPAISIELGSHTDSRGRDAYNDTLSQRRAEAAVDYIVDKGVERLRISAKGYGETQLGNRCDDGVNCSEDEHQLNRRTELRITKVQNEAALTAGWLSLEEIIRREELDRQIETFESTQVKIDENGRPQRLPEANNTVPLPALSPAENNLYVQALPNDYTGFKIEILRSEKPLSAEAVLFKQYEDVFVAKEKGVNVYYIGEFPDLSAARKYYLETVLPQNPGALLAEFSKGKKTYVR